MELTVEVCWPKIDDETFREWCVTNNLDEEKGSKVVSTAINTFEMWLKHSPYLEDTFGFRVGGDEGHNGEGHFCIVGLMEYQDFVSYVWTVADDKSMGEYALVRQMFGNELSSPPLPMCVDYPELMFCAIHPSDWDFMREDLEDV